VPIIGHSLRASTREQILAAGPDPVVAFHGLTISLARRAGIESVKRLMFAFASNPQATYGLSLLRRVASSRAFL
jgi:hypothetical protein